jgi:ferredoxin
MTNASARFAIIGTGAAALGVLDALLTHGGNAKITVFDIGDVPAPEPKTGTEAGPFYDELYADLRASGLRGFPPPKTHFGARLPVHPGGHSLIQSRSFGGLTNYWGATMLPFTTAELGDWPVPAEALAPHYARIATLAGISGGKDALDGYFNPAYVNRPAIPVTPSLARLSARVGTRTGGAYRILAGTNRCAIETRSEVAQACTACGECLAGCYRGAIYSARHSMATMLNDPRVKIVQGRVTRVDASTGSVHFDQADGWWIIPGFDRIFLAAGCLGTTEILMRSTGISQANPLRTNSVHVFPILNLGHGDGGKRDHVSLANLIFACLPVDHAAPMAQAQIYPNPDYLWRPQVPGWLWPLLRRAVAASRARLYWGRLFVHSGQSQSYDVELRGDALTLDEGVAPDRAEPGRVLKSLKEAVAGSGMRVLTRPTVLQKSSVHYGSTFGYGNSLLPISSTGEALPRVHICDSTVFPDMPAVSPTFTIMANARRTAMEVLDA